MRSLQQVALTLIKCHPNFFFGGGGRGVTYVTRSGKACLKVIFSTLSSFDDMKIEPFKFHNMLFDIVKDISQFSNS